MLNVISGLLAGGVAASTTSYESIATVTVGSGGSSSISFSSIPSTYKHLQIRSIDGYVTASFNPKITFNSDTGSNYSWHYLSGNGSAASAGSGSSQAFMYVNSNNAFPIPTARVIDILDYSNTNKNKTIRTLDGFDSNGGGYANLWSGAWYNTAAINTITIANGTFAQNSSFALYGIKG